MFQDKAQGEKKLRLIELIGSIISSARQGLIYTVDQNLQDRRNFKGEF